MDSTYIYASEDRLENPIKYEYTPYDGAPFLDVYLQSRCDTIKRITTNLTNFTSFTHHEITTDAIEKEYGNLYSGISELLKIECNKTEDKYGCICAVNLFASLLRKLLENQQTSEDIDLIFAFIKKFEVFKRIYLYYNKSTLLKVSDTYSNILQYTLFANILVHYIGIESNPEKKTIAFNALLKLNDTIASIADKLTAPLEVSLALYALNKEQDIYKIFTKELSI